jgi:hydroxysqualene dehydroxylase
MASTRADALILGGGFAGLSCASALAAAGARVVVAEKKPHLGGRAFSFKDPETGAVVDNGQHLFMGCYRETRRFLDRIGSSHLLRFSEKIRVDYADSSGKRDALSCPTFLGSPAHFALGVAGMRGLSLSDKLGLVRLDRALRAMKKGGIPAGLDKVTVRQWLTSLGQSARVQERLLDPVALGALNDDPSVAAATGFAQVLLGIFFQGLDDSRFGLSTVGLSELYTDQARAFVEKREGKILLSKKAVELVYGDGGRVTGARFESGETLEAGTVVSTLPPWDLAKVGLKGPWLDLKPAPIVSVSLWLDRPVVGEAFLGLIGTENHWVFNKSRILSLNGGGQYLSLVISGAHEHVRRDPKELYEGAVRDLKACLPEFESASVTKWKVVKEPFATLSPVPGSDVIRPGAGDGPDGFLFAGDWTQTRLPATIESACVSGHGAAAIIGE